MPQLCQDKLEHISYCRSKNKLKNSYYFLVSNDYYIIKLYTDKIFCDIYRPIKPRDNRMIETVGYWLNYSTLNLDNVHLTLRLKAVNNKDFLHWWTRYNFQIEIERLVY